MAAATEAELILIRASIITLQQRLTRAENTIQTLQTQLAKVKKG